MDSDFLIRTYTGHMINLQEGPPVEKINIEDIAHSLAHQCRYAGHVNKFYSVAEHSIYVSMLSPSKMYAAYFLLHDAHEAYYQDLTSPLKRFLMFNSGQENKVNTVYSGICDKADWAIMQAFGLRFSQLTALHDHIKEADKDVYKLERSFVTGDGRKTLPASHPLKKAPWGMDPMEAKEQFISVFEQYMA